MVAHVPLQAIAHLLQFHFLLYQQGQRITGLEGHMTSIIPALVHHRGDRITLWPTSTESTKPTRIPLVILLLLAVFLCPTAVLPSQFICRPATLTIYLTSRLYSFFAPIGKGLHRWPAVNRHWIYTCYWRAPPSQTRFWSFSRRLSSPLHVKTSNWIVYNNSCECFFLA